MAYRLAIGNTVGVKVEGSTRDENGGDKPYKFVLVCDRLSNEEIRQLLNEGTTQADHWFEQHAHDWRNQQLVVDDDGRPAAFSVESLRMLLSIAGMASTCWNAYLAQVVATAKN